MRARTMAWARIVVVGLKLCPFAADALDSGTVRMAVTSAANPGAFGQVVNAEVARVVRTAPEELSTTLIVAPEFCTRDFEAFYEFCCALEEEIEADEGLVDEVMVAGFHPAHAWGGVGDDDAVNFDKRAPYPIVNILRARVVDGLVEQGRTLGILERNQRTLESVGTEGLRRLYEGLVGLEEDVA